MYLIVEEDRLDEAVLALVRIGLDRIDGYATLDAFARSGGTLTHSEVSDLQGLEARRVSGEARILDVRGKAEYDEGHVPDAVNIAHTRRLVRLAELPKVRGSSSIASPAGEPPPRCRSSNDTVTKARRSTTCSPTISPSPSRTRSRHRCTQRASDSGS